MQYFVGIEDKTKVKVVRIVIKVTHEDFFWKEQLKISFTAENTYIVWQKMSELTLNKKPASVGQT